MPPSRSGQNRFVVSQVYDESTGRYTDWDGEVVVSNLPVPFDYDYFDVTARVSSGEAEGEIETIVYKTGGSGGTTVATINLTYDADGEIDTFTRT